MTGRDPARQGDALTRRDPEQPAAMPERLSCQLCGTVADGGSVPLGWSLETTPRGPRATCAACTRTHVRSIEGKLDVEHW